MAVAAAELGGAEGAGAAEGEGMSSQAKAAVSQAAAGRGRKLTPEVKNELRRRGSKAQGDGSLADKLKDTPAGNLMKVSEAPSRAADAVTGAPAKVAGFVKGPQPLSASVSSPSGRSGLVLRMGLAFIAFLLALELASYLSGRYFSYSLGKGGQKLAGAAQHLDLYPGQSAKLALQKTLPPAAR